MKHIVFFIVFAFVFIFNAYAQKNNEIVYLKNGSIIKGSVTEIIPDESVKIQTKDGSIFVYKMTEVSKISREENSYIADNPGPHKGYVGFVEFGIGTNFRGIERLNILTIHGYQINPNHFIGIGISGDIASERVPVFIDVRSTMDKKISPFFDLRLGVDTYNDEFYASPAIGYRFGLKNRMAVNVGLTLELYNILKKHTTENSTKENDNTISIRTNFEF